jgi:hypothetical protein
MASEATVLFYLCDRSCDHIFLFHLYMLRMAHVLITYQLHRTPLFFTAYPVTRLRRWKAGRRSIWASFTFVTRREAFSVSNRASFIFATRCNSYKNSQFRSQYRRWYSRCLNRFSSIAFIINAQSHTISRDVITYCITLLAQPSTGRMWYCYYW